MSIFSLTLLAATLAAEPTAATPPSSEPTMQNVKAAIQRSLPYIEQVGTEWMTKRKCNSCHVVTFLVWSHNEAAAHGLEVDRQKLAQWTKWSLADSLSDRRWFKLRPQAIEALKTGGLPDGVLAKLKPLEGKNYLTQKEFLDAAEKAIGAEDFKLHKDALVKAAALPNNGGGADTLNQLLLARAGLPEDKEVTQSYDAIRALLLEWQEPGGSWLAQGQLPQLKWAEPEMNDATTLWSILAVSAAKSPGDALVGVRQRGIESMQKSSPGITLQSLALHTAIAHKFGEKERAEGLLKEFLARQSADGGWNWVKENKESDAFSTGQALYVLGLLGRDGNDPVVRKAWEYLLRTQTADGSWQVPQNLINSRPRGLNVYPYWGTAWCAIGLLQTLPAESPR